MAIYQCIDCRRLDTDDVSEARYHANFNNHCVVMEGDDED